MVASNPHDLYGGVELGNGYRGDTHSEMHGRTLGSVENVLAYGAVGDGSTDDTAAIQACINAVSAVPTTHTTMVFPHGQYKFGDLTWPIRSGADERWLRVEVTGKLLPQTTMEIPARRIHLVGLGGGTLVGFDDYPQADIVPKAGVDPIVNWGSSATSALMEGFNINGCEGTGIKIDSDVNLISLKGVSVHTAAAGTGDALEIGGSFGFNIEQCVFSAPSATAGTYAINMTSLFIPTGQVRVRNSCLRNRGCKWSVPAPIANDGGPFSFVDVLTEGMLTEFIWIDTTNAPFRSLKLDGVEMADSVLNPDALLKITGTGVYNVEVKRSLSNQIVQSGSDAINNLIVTEGRSTDTTVNQTTSVTHTDRNGRFSVGSRFRQRPMITLPDGGGGPDVSGGNLFKTANTAPANVIAFGGGVSGQEITVLVTDANTTFLNNATTPHGLKLAGGANFGATANDTIRFVHDGTDWYETGRSVN